MEGEYEKLAYMYLLKNTKSYAWCYIVVLH